MCSDLATKLSDIVLLQNVDKFVWQLGNCWNTLKYFAWNPVLNPNLSTTAIFSWGMATIQLEVHIIPYFICWFSFYKNSLFVWLACAIHALPKSWIHILHLQNCSKDCRNITKAKIIWSRSHTMNGYSVQGGQLMEGFATSHPTKWAVSSYITSLFN